MPEADQLTNREKEILCLLVVEPDLSNQEYAGKLGIARGTFNRHADNIYNKLGARSRLGAVCQFLRRYPDYTQLLINGN